MTIELRDDRGFSLHASGNLSAGGAFFDRSIPLPVGAKVHVSFALPGEPTPISCAGEVVNVPDATTFGMGVRFSALSAEDGARLARFTREVEDLRSP